jgi:Ca-activated chloride channel family protein
VSPLTDDVATLRSLLGPLAPDIMPSAGDRMAGAIDRAGALLVQAPGRGRHMIVLSDGSADSAEALRSAASLRGQGVTVNVVGVGADATVRASLQQVAASGGGRYVDLAQLPALLDDLHAQAGGAESSNATAAAGVELSRWLDGGAWLMPLLLLLAACMARRGYV